MADLMTHVDRIRSPLRLIPWWLAAIALPLVATPALAQRAGPLPVVVVDARGLLASLGQDSVTAGELDLEAGALPARAWGGVAGLQVYPIRRRSMAIGVGAEALMARTQTQPLDADGAPLGPVIERRLQGFIGTVSINFGTRAGWSYLSGGMGRLTFATFARPLPAGAALPSRSTQHFGGGARWFTRDHLAVGFDVRFYLTRPQTATPAVAGRERMRVVVVAVGISIK
jgi:hypothetical protein